MTSIQTQLRKAWRAIVMASALLILTGWTVLHTQAPTAPVVLAQSEPTVTSVTLTPTATATPSGLPTTLATMTSTVSPTVISTAISTVIPTAIPTEQPSADSGNGEIYLPLIQHKASELAISSPDGTLRLHFQLRQPADPNIDTPTPEFWVQYQGATLLAPSLLGLTFDANTAALGALTITDVILNQGDTTYPMPFGERDTLRDRYNELRIELQEVAAPNRAIHLLLRAYNEGVAVRYRLPAQAGWESAQIVGEETQFVFPENKLAYGQIGTEGVYQPSLLSTLSGHNENPLTLVPLPANNGAPGVGPALSITEAHVADYPRMVLTRAAPQRLQVMLEGTANVRLPFQTPWRVLIVGDTPADLLTQNDLLFHLSPANTIADTSWIKPGQAMRIGPLNTAAALEVIDFAAAHGIEYVEYDVGWYPNGYWAEFDPASDATQVVPEIDMPQVIAYADERGIGLWLYVNYVALRQQLDEILPLFESWGVKGIKFGYVDGRTQEGINFLHDALAKAAEHHLMIDIHDDYRPSGMSRTYPNLMTQEGVRGNEHFTGADYTTTLPFTRMLAGAADHTFPYYSDRLNVTRAHQLAGMIVIFSPVQFVLWYDSPLHYGGEAEMALIGSMPTVWDETVVLDGTIGETISVARRKGEAWYVGTLTNTTARTVGVPLTFLPPGRRYTIHTYRDESATSVAIEHGTVTSEIVINATMLPSGGHAMWLEPAE